MFILDEEEKIKERVWLEEHPKSCKFAGAENESVSGGMITYHFTPTSIGVVKKISCICEEECDVTNYDW